MTTPANSPRRRVLLATRNPGKRREIVAILADLPLSPFGVKGLPAAWAVLDHFPGLPEAVEDGRSFAENAAKKAAHYARLTGLWTLADDSGLEVDCLDGAPGVLSARFAGPAADDRANNAKLVTLLAGVPSAHRTARFRCVAVLAEPHRVLATAEGAIEGLIIDAPRGSGGFGYDPHFLIPSLGLTTAELDPAHKNRISHRAQALRTLLPALQCLLASAVP